MVHVSSKSTFRSSRSLNGESTLELLPLQSPHFLTQCQCTGSVVAFGSIDDVSVPISSSPGAAVPPTKAEGIKTFGSVPVLAAGHVNGKPYLQDRP
jgi:hypothetical protein